jgi:hypothetical protein
MAEISTPRIEGISDAGPGSTESSEQKPRPKPDAAEKPAAVKAPEIGEADEEEKRELDEMA